LKERWLYFSQDERGVFAPEYELECYRALASANKGDRFRFDLTGLVDRTAIWFGQQIEDIETIISAIRAGLAGMRRVREKVNAACDQYGGRQLTACGGRLTPR
jgi:hypothetical protein